MRLFQIALSSCIYHAATSNDHDYREFVSTVGPIPDLTLDEHRIALLQWLNGWRCRQFIRRDHPLASAQINEWYHAFVGALPPLDRNTWELTKEDLGNLAFVYADLRNRVAGQRGRDHVHVHVGPTGAAKVLFAVRPEALVPWDDPLRNELCYDGSDQSYVDHIQRTQEELDDLGNDCHQRGIDLAHVPRVLHQPNTTLPELIDEYYQVTVRMGYTLPDGGTIQQWAKWI